MSRRPYLAALLRLYLGQPAAPHRASRQDWATAQTLYTRGVPLHHFAHAVRLATLRRLHAHGPLPPVHSLAYYRHVLDQLTPAELDRGYVDYIAHRYQSALAKVRPDRQDRALSDRR